MNTDKGRFEGKHSEVSDRILKAYYAVYNELGAGFLESVYQAAMEAALSQDGLNITRQVILPVFFRGKVIANFCADLIVEDKQVLNYLKATPLEVGFLLNFGPKPEFKRFVFDDEQKKIRVPPCESVVGFQGGEG